jgi:FSR family fosmidomycin resistance protein-like MFS transporter
MSAASTLSVQRDVRVISLIGFAHGTSHYYQLAFVTVLLIMKDRVGFSFTDVGALGAIFYAVSGVCQTAAGFAVDRYGARPILAGGLALIGIGLALTSVADSFLSFAAIAVIAAVGNCVFHPADFAILNSSVNEKRLGRAYSIHGLGGSLGWAAAPVIYFLSDLVGRSGAALIGALPGLILAVVVWFARTDIADHRAETRAAAAREGTGGLGLFLQAPILLCFAYFILIAVNTIGIQQMAIPAWKEMFGVSGSFAALCLIVFMVSSAFGMLIGGFFADSVKRHDIVACSGLVVAAALMVPIAMASVSPAMLVVLLALAGAAGGVTNPSRDMIVRGATPPGSAGKVFGFVYSGLDVGSFVGPPLFGYLMDLHLPQGLFWVAAVVYCLNALMVLTIKGASPRRAAVAAE